MPTRPFTAADSRPELHFRRQTYVPQHPEAIPALAARILEAISREPRSWRALHSMVVYRWKATEGDFRATVDQLVQDGDAYFRTADGQPLLTVGAEGSGAMEVIAVGAAFCRAAGYLLAGAETGPARGFTRWEAGAFLYALGLA